MAEVQGGQTQLLPCALLLRVASRDWADESPDSPGAGRNGAQTRDQVQTRVQGLKRTAEEGGQQTVGSMTPCGCSRLGLARPETLLIHDRTPS